MYGGKTGSVASLAGTDAHPRRKTPPAPGMTTSLQQREAQTLRTRKKKEEGEEGEDEQEEETEEEAACPLFFRV